MKEHPTHKGYFVTEDGRVFSVKTSRRIDYTKQPKELRVRKGSDGYCMISSRQGRLTVHRLVAETFIPNPNNLPCINHKDENKSNNHVSNLEWCDYQYNIEYSHAKTYTIECIETGEIFKVFNLKKWCRENDWKPGSDGSLIATFTGKRNQYKGFRILKREG